MILKIIPISKKRSNNDITNVISFKLKLKVDDDLTVCMLTLFHEVSTLSSLLVISIVKVEIKIVRKTIRLYVF